MSPPVQVEDLDAAIEQYKARGYRLDMIFPAEDPREALVSRGEERLRLQKPVRSQGTDQYRGSPYSVRASATGDWLRGRAGMEYRDLIPDRLGGKVIASHIRLTEGGEVPDYVHYHKIDFQVIYCKKGRIKVVYQDQGEPFWLEAGDLVLQPPEIRHRVLECTAGAEVIEITTPAEHETWVDHEMELPNSSLNSARDFSGQRFVRHIACGAEWEDDEILELQSRDTGVSDATGKMLYVWVTKQEHVGIPYTAAENENMISIFLELNDKECLSVAIMKTANAVKQKGWIRKALNRLAIHRS
jgi:quercetin dioxygenase-like cupin family protein